MARPGGARQRRGATGRPSWYRRRRREDQKAPRSSELVAFWQLGRVRTRQPVTRSEAGGRDSFGGGRATARARSEYDVSRSAQTHRAGVADATQRLARRSTGSSTGAVDDCWIGESPGVGCGPGLPHPGARGGQPEPGSPRVLRVGRQYRGGQDAGVRGARAQRPQARPPDLLPQARSDRIPRRLGRLLRRGEGHGRARSGTRHEHDGPPRRHRRGPGAGRHESPLDRRGRTRGQLLGAHRVRVASSRRTPRRRRRGGTLRIRSSVTRVRHQPARAVRGHRRGPQRALGGRRDRVRRDSRGRVLARSERHPAVRPPSPDANARDPRRRRKPRRDIHHAGVARRAVDAGVRRRRRRRRGRRRGLG